MGTLTSHEDTGDILKFVLKGLDIKNDFYNGWALSHLFNAGVFKRRANDRNLSQLDLSFMNTDEIARALTMLSGSGDDIIDAEELMRALNHLLPGNPYQQDTDGIWYYGNSFSGEPLDDIYGFIRGTGFSEEKNGPRFRQAGLKEAIASGKFYEFIKTRVPESSLPYLPGDPNYRGPRTASLAPVVLDLDGLAFTSLASSAAQYDVDGSGVRRNVAWTKDALLAFDADGDGAITKTNELSFVSYKPGAKTDLEGLGQLCSLDDAFH